MLQDCLSYGCSMETKFHVEAIRNWQEWDAFIERSPQGTVFSSSDFLRAQGKKHLCFNVLKGDQRKAGLCLFVSEDETEVELGDYAAYNGICFEPMPCEQKPVRYFSEQCQITRFLVEAVISKYQRVRISLAPQHPDLRPFLWYNYTPQMIPKSTRLGRVLPATLTFPTCARKTPSSSRTRFDD